VLHLLKLQVLLIIFFLNIVGVDNGRGGGFDQCAYKGDSSVSMSGRTYHTNPESSNSSGVKYFVHDGSKEELLQHGEKFKIEDSILLEIHKDLIEKNKHCFEYKFIGDEIAKLLDRFHFHELNIEEKEEEIILKEIEATINTATLEHDVAA